MYCRNCGNQINDGELFCSKCGAKLENESHTADKQPFIPNNGANQKTPLTIVKKKTKAQMLAYILTTAIIIVAVLWIKSTFFGGLNTKRFDKKNGNTISTNAFKELASDESDFESYSVDDYRKKENTTRNTILEQKAWAVNRKDSKDGIYLLTYAGEKECKASFYKDMIEIISEEAPQHLNKAERNKSGNLYLFEFTGGMFGNHSYCFYIEGNSMLYAITNTDEDESPYEYLKGYSTELNLNLSDSHFHKIIDDFLYDYNNR